MRRLRVEWSPGRKVTARLVVPSKAGRVGVLLAHGAGAGQDHPFIVAIRDGLAAAGQTVMTFAYPYLEEGRKRPDRQEMLLACHRAAADRLGGYCESVVLAGKSMGGRMASHLAGDEGWPAAGLVYYGYPLVPLGKGEPRSTDHLDRIEVPQLFFAGTRDRLSPPDLVSGVVGRLPAADLVVVDDADHSFKVPKRAGRSWDEVLADLVATTARWIGDRCT